MFLSDYPRGLLNCFWLWGFSAFDPLPVALALPLPFLVAPRRFPVSLLRLPPRPLACPLPAVLAAIPLARLPGSKALLAPFEQTVSWPWPALPPTRRLLFARACRTLRRRRAHGR